MNFDPKHKIHTPYIIVRPEGESDKKIGPFHYYLNSIQRHWENSQTGMVGDFYNNKYYEYIYPR